jgi:FAD/FMN-containing dehydrogenase
MVVGGQESDIGAGGFLLGGGISYYGPRKSWASDNVIGATVVLADGSIVRAFLDSYWIFSGRFVAEGIDMAS